MGEYGFPSKLITMVKAMYEHSKCAVVDSSRSHDWFDVRTGVKTRLLHAWISLSSGD